MNRSYGADSLCHIKRLASYGALPAGNFQAMPFVSSGLGAEQGLIKDAVLGYGRHPQDPSYDVVSDDGDLVVPADPVHTGFWLTGLLGDSVSALNKASGRITFSANPSNLQTITLNSVVWTFVTGTPSGNQIQIGANLGATLDAAVTALNASANSSINVATYAHTSGTAYLAIEYDTAGTAGNAYTLAASVATVSAATLVGGGYRHRFTAGKSSEDLGLFAIQIGHPKVPVYELHDSAVINSLSLQFQRTGVPNLTFNVIAQGQRDFTTSQAGTPTTLTLERMSQFQAFLKSGGERIANVTAASFTYSNNCEKVNEIREDEKIGGADATIPTISGQLTSRFAGTGLSVSAQEKTAIDLEFGWRLSPSKSLTITLPKVRLQRSKRPIQGPGGVEESFQYEAFQDSVSGESMIIDLINELDGTQYDL